MHLGDASDWAVLIGMLVGILTIALAVWKLARAASRLELMNEKIASNMEQFMVRMGEKIQMLQDIQKNQGLAITELQSSVNKLSWEVGRMRSEQ